MKKLILTAIISFVAGVAATILAIGGAASYYIGGGAGADMRVEITTDGVAWDTSANQESVMILFNNLPKQVRDMCCQEYKNKVAAGQNKVSLKYPEGELHFDMEQKTLQICSEGVNIFVEGVDREFCDELFLGKAE